MNADELISRLSGPLSLRRRVATTVALLGGLLGAAFVGLLWLSEPVLPLRTQLAFGALVLVGLGWAGYGSWVLSRRTPLFALDRVIAGWLALAASGLLAGLTALVALTRGGVHWAAYLMVVVLLMVAAGNLVRARALRGALLRRKRELGG
ncbi:hypothetical protein [Catellatospora sichuanensis]|uniref:hypothetical protein n=1 Tax=Catellatospora sichuanensis TaxID=1969805 RepID=UPI001183DBD7|nr:hypothetical protein [Catellatospora sichuanensis]